MKNRLSASTAALILAFATNIPAQAKILWQGDFETGDMSQWSTPIHPAGHSLVKDCVFDGSYAGKITLSGDESFLWRGNKDLNRSEFHHRYTAGEDGEGSTHEASDTFFAFSFYLPQQLSEHKHELGYWESDKTWQQMFRFNIHGSELSFQETAAKNVLWKLPNGAAPGQWHRIALQIHWSTDATKGAVEVWVNGKHMGKHNFQTLPVKDALMFTQIGILRSQENTRETIYVDGALRTDNLTELLERNRHLMGKTCDQP
ncbi:polysaccharide lyase [Cellvibrio fontiphilus]|uniref:Polysaccharide lyase n=1 Tax=Cellvibrio fontiphilus TaxID=1815559 RepID=A0ABV7FCW6_9GAMM